MPTLALLAYLAFMSVAFGWRSWLQYRRTGDLGFRGFRGGAVERTAALLFTAGLLAALGAPLAELLGWLAPPRALARPGFHAAGLLAFAAGFAVTLVAQLQMGASWRIGVDPEERTALVTHGVFGCVRNPIFTGMLLALVGLLLLVPNRLSMLALLVTLVGVEIQVRAVEEPHLLRAHGERYRAYARSVGRFVPGLGRLLS
jgi:protein-S-isoprenylcysteine O-methyltransferase Ste14